MRLIQITDLHLSDRTDTAAADALEWAIGAANRLAPDLVAVTGDITTYGTQDAARHFLEAAANLNAPWLLTPGNAELRTPGAMPVLSSCPASCRSLRLGEVQFLLPDTSSGKMLQSDRHLLEHELSAAGPAAILTHYPMDVLDADSRAWIEALLAEHPVELYLAGHRHFDRTRSIHGCQEIMTRGLDPDKAFGGPPGIHLLQRHDDGTWTAEAIPWPHAHNLLPAETEHSPVGWSIHGDPLEAMQQTQRTDLNVLELRPREPTYNLAATADELASLRRDRAIYLSWHLPNLTWNETSAAVEGEQIVARQVDDARACGVDALTVHVPRIGAARMSDAQGARTDAWETFLACYDKLFRAAAADGIRLSIENIHNAPGTPEDRTSREFATEIGEYLDWIAAVTDRIGGDITRIGAHFDVGHARNNGALGNRQPLGDWYARIGANITGYHIHQVRPHEETGKLTNHRDIPSVYSRTISYAGFLHAWSKSQLNRAPLFIEVRDTEERQRTVNLFQELFAKDETS